MLIVMMQVRLYQLSTPVIKLSISISKQNKGISSLLKQLVSDRKRRYLFHKFIDHTSQGIEAIELFAFERLVSVQMGSSYPILPD